VFQVNNPLSALGLTTGLVDVAVLSRLLPQALVGEGNTSWPMLLDRYSSMRRNDFVNNVQKQSIQGKLRLHSTGPKVAAERDDFFNMLNRNPGFGMFVASTLIETVPDDLLPSPLYVPTRFSQRLAS